ncbi:MAG: PAS domain-containing sensor histidine kinase, partial [Oscillospiraceae bacterium]|nr:PAS domain-containing sensor histidine kinase [Oscillospiraceae bacterium]
MTKRIFCSIFFAAFGVFLTSLALIMGILYGYFTNVQQAQLRMQTALAAQGVSNEGAGYFRGLDLKDCRITWIGADGTVLYDSQAGTAENHLAREEVVEALSTGYGESRRYSATLMLRSLYAAQRLADGTVLRLSIAQNSILTLTLGMAQPICTVFLVAVILSPAGGRHRIRSQQIRIAPGNHVQFQ